MSSFALPTLRPLAGLLGLVCLVAIGCGEDQSSTFEVAIESEDGTMSTLSDTVADIDLPGGPTGTTITPGVIRITLGSDTAESVEITLITSEEHTAPGVFAIDGHQHVVRYTTADGTLFGDTGEGFVVLDTCPADLDDRARGSLDSVEVYSEERDSTRVLGGSFDVGIQSVQFNGEDSPLHCQ